MEAINRFNIRVYGVLMHEGKVLISHETYHEHSFTKFPGGGLEYGEGPEECVLREFKEELDLEVRIVRHLYTTGFFQRSAFRPNDQVVSIYYLLSAENLDPQAILNIHNQNEIESERFDWVPMPELHEGLMTFPIDKKVLRDILSTL
jgi:ADP-ribose pyrophosphatase YjhB (NUDIX family)